MLKSFYLDFICDILVFCYVQLMKQFLASYLHCHGMLFSGVGLDGFRECCVNMLREFSVLLRSSPPCISTSHLLQIMVINMYAITNTELKGECCYCVVLRGG